MKVKNIMTRNVRIVDSGTILNDVARDMQEFDVGVFPVQDGNEIVGIVTDRDIVTRAIAKGRAPESTGVGEIMTPGAVCCSEEEDIQSAAELMEREQIHRLLVFNEENKLSGIVSTSDLTLRSGNEHLSVEVVERISEPGHV